MSGVSTNNIRKVKWEIEELSLLFEISGILDSSINLQDVLGPVLKVLSKHTKIVGGLITLFNNETGDITVEASYGLSLDQERKGKYRIGEGITGLVVQTGKPSVVPRTSEEPKYLDKMGFKKNDRERELSFICLPIKLENKVIGTLSVYRVYSDNFALNDFVRLLTVVCSLISKAVKLRQEALKERDRLLSENIRLQKELEAKFHPSNIIGNSKVMQEVYRLIEQVSKSDTTVLITGESGTGKELVAHAIHYNSFRANKPFIKVNCAALPENIIESELFGHEKGAFTGAIKSRKGRFELADGGTLFLDEIGDLTPQIQIKLLRVLQEREFEKVGGTDTIKVNVRIIAATNRNLEELIEKGLFRQDLYYRLNVFPIHLPPLRDRKSDILLLTDYFVEKYSKMYSKNIRRISTPAIDMLMAYHWPGNVRELENCIERAVLVSNDEVIHGHHLPPTLQTGESSDTIPKGPLKAKLESIEREFILDALKSTSGNMAKASKLLGLTERQMGVRVKKYKIEPKRFRTKM